VEKCVGKVEKSIKGNPGNDYRVCRMASVKFSNSLRLEVLNGQVQLFAL